MDKNVNKEKKTKDRKKFIRGIVVIVIVGALLLSVAATLIYNVIYYASL